MSEDLILILVSAIVGGIFALAVAFAGALFKDWLDARRKKREQSGITLPTAKDIRRLGVESIDEAPMDSSLHIDKESKSDFIKY